jgi:hypothetical protein
MPLQFVSSIRKIGSAAVDATVASEVHSPGQKFGFQSRTASIRPLLNVICRLNRTQDCGTNCLPLTIISLVLRQAYNYVRRDPLKRIFDEHVSARTACTGARC